MAVHDTHKKLVGTNLSKPSYLYDLMLYMFFDHMSRFSRTRLHLAGFLSSFWFHSFLTRALLKFYLAAVRRITAPLVGGSS